MRRVRRDPIFPVEMAGSGPGHDAEFEPCHEPNRTCPPRSFNMLGEPARFMTTYFLPRRLTLGRNTGRHRNEAPPASPVILLIMLTPA